jgi:hypothetical protein
MSGQSSLLCLRDNIDRQWVKIKFPSCSSCGSELIGVPGSYGTSFVLILLYFVWTISITCYLKLH